MKQLKFEFKNFMELKLLEFLVSKLRETIIKQNYFYRPAI